MSKKIVYMRPIEFYPQPQRVRELGELGNEEMKRVIERADRVGYTHEGSVVDPTPYERIRLNDPNGEGYHRAYFATLE